MNLNRCPKLLDQIKAAPTGSTRSLVGAALCRDGLRSSPNNISFEGRAVQLAPTLAAILALLGSTAPAASGRPAPAR